MRKFLFSAVFLAGYLVLTSSGGKPKPPWEEENVSFPMMNQEIRHSMQENERQQEMKKKQNINLGAEVVNKKQWSKFKDTNKDYPRNKNCTLYLDCCSAEAGRICR